MYLKVTLAPRYEDHIRIPLQYNYYIQSLIYRLLEKNMANFIHEQGFKLEKRQFKMFCFSQLIGDYKIDKETKEIVFSDNIDLLISSPMKEFINQLINALLLNDSIMLHRKELIVKSLNIFEEKVNESTVKVKSLSPITVYSTLYKADGSKYTCYFSPMEKDFNILISENIYKKYKAYFGKEPQEKQFSIKPIGKCKLHVLNYKTTLIKGYTGTFLLEGDTELINLALDTGLGGKNSQGFGFIKRIPMGD